MATKMMVVSGDMRVMPSMSDAIMMKRMPPIGPVLPATLEMAIPEHLSSCTITSVGLAAASSS